MVATSGTSRHRPGSRVSWSWMNSAACRGEDLELFFGPAGEREPERTVREGVAKSICGQCRVRVACLEYALAAPQKGVWGGMTDEERVKTRRRQMRRAADHRARESIATDAADKGIDLIEAAS